MATSPARVTFDDIGLRTRERLGYSLFAAAQRWPNREYIAFEGRRYSYGEIARWTNLVARFLIGCGIRPGDRFLAQLPNSVELAVLQFAMWRIGAVGVPVIPVYRHHEMRHIIADAAPAGFAGAPQLGSRAFCSELDELIAEIGIAPVVRLAVGGPAPEGWLAFPPPPAPDDASEAALLPPPAEADATLLILYTSGTTAAPKGVKLTGGGILSHVGNVTRLLGLNESDVFIAGSPIAHVAGMSMGVLLPMAVGARTVMLPSWNADAAVALIEREQATYMSSAPIFLADIVERYEGGASPSHRLRCYMAGGAAIPPALIYRAEAVGIKASRIYGMTELGGTCSMARTDDPIDKRAHTDGKVIFGTEVEIVGEDNVPVPFGEIGEVRIRGPQLMLGYTDPEATARRMDAEGWFYPGDVGHIDAEGWLTMTGRSKDIINRGGEKFSAQDIEMALVACPQIATAAVVGAPDARFGEVVAAFVTLRPGVVWEGPEPVLAYLEAAKVAKQKLPVRWHVVDQIPTTATGKVQKQLLIAQLAELV